LLEGIEPFLTRTPLIEKPMLYYVQVMSMIQNDPYLTYNVT
jgi:hypothetical protein